MVILPFAIFAGSLQALAWYFADDFPQPGDHMSTPSSVGITVVLAMLLLGAAVLAGLGAIISGWFAARSFPSARRQTIGQGVEAATQTYHTQENLEHHDKAE